MFERIRIMRVLRFFNNKCVSNPAPAVVALESPFSLQILSPLVASSVESVRFPALTATPALPSQILMYVLSAGPTPPSKTSERPRYGCVWGGGGGGGGCVHACGRSM